MDQQCCLDLKVCPYYISVWPPCGWRKFFFPHSKSSAKLSHVKVLKLAILNEWRKTLCNDTSLTFGVIELCAITSSLTGQDIGFLKFVCGRKWKKFLWLMSSFFPSPLLWMFVHRGRNNQQFWKLLQATLKNHESIWACSKFQTEFSLKIHWDLSFCRL